MPAQQPPRIKGVPVLGNAISFARDPFGFLDRLREYDADVVAVDLPGQRGYALCHPDAVETVLHQPAVFEKGAFVESQIDDLVGDGLIVAEGEVWQRQRQRLQPAFFRQRVLDYAPTMVERTREMTADWTDGEVRDIRRDAMELTLRVLVSTVFDLDLDEHIETFDDATTVITDHFRPTNPSAYLPTWVPTPGNRRYRRAIGSLEDVVTGAIAERRSRADPGSDMLGTMLAAEGPTGDAMDDEQLRDELMTMLLAGHETTALALTFALYELADAPELQDRLQREVDALGGDPTAEDLDDLTDTEAVIQEAMRLYPPISFLSREPTRDVTVAGCEIPEGSMVLLPQWTIHRDERFFDEPLTFDPDRWLDERERPAFAYFPFGGGPRRCIGANFAMVEAKLLLGTLCRRFAFERTPETSLDLMASLTTRPKGAVELRVSER